MHLLASGAAVCYDWCTLSITLLLWVLFRILQRKVWMNMTSLQLDKSPNDKYAKIKERVRSETYQFVLLFCVWVMMASMCTLNSYPWCPWFVGALDEWSDDLSW